MPLGELQNGRYRSVQPLGSGSMGEVYLMEDTRIHRQVAIKVIRADVNPYPDHKAVEDSARLFQREARAIAALEHPNILPLYDFGEERVENTLINYMVMPFCPEGSLANWLHNRNSVPPLSLSDIANLTNQAADALQYAHDHHVIHLDVKPSNFLIRSNSSNVNRPRLLLADFGIAKLSATTTGESRAIRGTPVAMAPEQWSGRPVPATDQYALAVMLYSILVGHPPFSGSMEHLMYQHINTPVPPPTTQHPHLPAAVDPVLLRALEKNPTDRFPSIVAFARALEYALTGTTSEPASPSLPPPQAGELRATLIISRDEALQGARRRIMFPNGQPGTVDIPPGAYHNQVIRLEPPRDSKGQPLMETLLVTLAIEEELATYRSDNNAYHPTPAPAFPPAAGQGTPAQVIPGPPFGQQAALSNEQQRPASTFPQGEASTPVIRKASFFSGRTKILVPILLALLLILGSISAYAVIHNNQVATQNSQRTATAQAQGTASAHATLTAQNNATATANANATATAVADPYGIGNAPLTFSDPLKNNAKGFNWDTTTTPLGEKCSFPDGTYHVYEPTKDHFTYCNAAKTDFANFAFEVNMQITKGLAAGMLFRFDAKTTHTYMFLLSRNGNCTLYYYPTVNSAPTLLIGPTASTIIRTALNDTNTIAVVARGATMTIYVNHQQIESVDDTHSTHGQIGFVAIPPDQASAPTEAVFTNAKVWKL